jgi:hypothetical protein
MVLYARNDIQAQTCHGGGPTHRRPTKVDGSPIPIWGIDCEPCVAALAGDHRWSASRYRIPRTPDEEEADRETLEIAQAAQRQAEIQMAQEAVRARQGAVLDARPDIDPTDIAITGSETAPVSPGAGDGARDRDALVQAAKGNYSALGKPELKDLARDRGLSVGGTKEDLVARHAEHEVDHQ